MCMRTTEHDTKSLTLLDEINTFGPIIKVSFGCNNPEYDYAFDYSRNSAGHVAVCSVEWHNGCRHTNSSQRQECRRVGRFASWAPESYVAMLGRESPLRTCFTAM